MGERVNLAKFDVKELITGKRLTCIMAYLAKKCKTTKNRPLAGRARLSLRLDVEIVEISEFGTGFFGKFAGCAVFFGGGRVGVSFC